MKFSVIDRREPAGQPLACDVSLGAYAPEATLAEVLDRLVDLDPRLTPIGPDPAVDLDGVPVPAESRLADLPLRAGCAVTLRAATPGAATLSAATLSAPTPSPAQSHALPRRPVLSLVEIAGPDCGLSVELPPGRYALGPAPAPGLAAGPVLKPALYLHLDVEGSGVTPVDAGAVRLDGRPLLDTGPAAAGAVLAVGDALFRLSLPPRDSRGPDGAGADAYGRVPLIRTPRVASPLPPATVAVPAAPAASPTPAPMSWLLMLAPLPIGVVMALVFSPFFLIMTMMTPMMGLARWFEGRMRDRRERRRVAAESRAAAEALATDLDAVRLAIAVATRAAWPDLGELWRRSRTGRQLWQVRPGDPDELTVVVGVGVRAWSPDLGRRDDALRAVPELVGVLAQRTRLDDVPVPVELRDRAGLGLVGPARQTRRLAATVVLDLVTRHGPADLGLGLLVEPGRAGDWDWTKWLPHLAGEDGTTRVATTADGAAALLTVLADTTPTAPRPVVVVDGDDLLTGTVAALLGRLTRSRGRVLVVTGDARRLPSVCHSIVELAADGTATVTDAVTGERTEGVRAVLAAPEVAAGTARALAGWTDPERATPAALLPDRARLLDLLGAADADAIEHRWQVAKSASLRADHEAAAGLVATLGVTEQGPLAVDLLTDGPHGLIVGTTGAGKSELLRTLVASLACRYSPERLTFLLVDFKGGGAFDACAALPHTVGLVTDLDEHLAARALRCLRAELRHRERRLREAGVTDLRDYVAPDPPLPRLLIVIDEFATLAVELPGFLSALVDVAQRGRSLGIHLLLATQRPQGVVDGKIRANTNLRIALRVQDDADSRDVLGTRLAADIDRRRPGRGYVRFGAGEILAFQSALASASATSGPANRLEVSLFPLVAAPHPDAPMEPEKGPSDLASLVDAAAQAFARAGYDSPRVPWPAPLPDLVDAWSLPDGGPDAAPVPIGLVDLPDEQRSDVFCWRPDDGASLILGGDAAATATVLATACLALARGRTPDRQRIFVLDGSGGALAALAGLPQVAAVVGVDDAERLTRVLDWLDAEVVRRRTADVGGPAVLVVLAGWGAVVEGAERAGLSDAATRLERLLRDGAAARIGLLLSAPHERAVPGRILAQLPTKLCLRLADPAGYTALGLRVREVPDLTGTRAIDLQTRQELVIARYGDGGSAGLADAVGRIAQRHPDAVPPAEVNVLPDLVPVADVLGASAVIGGSWRLGIGRDYRDLSVAALTLAPGMHAIVSGPPGSGRTTVLRVLATAARVGAPESTVCVVATDPAAWAGSDATEVVTGFDELQHWPAPGRALLLVDGIEAMGPVAGMALDQLMPTVPPTAHVIVAGRGEALRGVRPWQRAVTLSRTGLLLRPTAEDGELLRIRLPLHAPLRPVPGRGYLVDAGGLTQIQAAWAPGWPALTGGRASLTGIGLR